MTAQFCSQCGAALVERPPTRCGNCGAEHWLNAKPAACALVLRGDQILLARRAIAPWRDHWCAPGGFCDSGEHPIDAAECETLEETGLRIRVTGAAGIWLARYADDDSDPEADEITVAYYFAELLGGAQGAVDASETAEVGWFTLDDAPRPLAPPTMLPTILEATRAAHREGRTTTPLPELPLPKHAPRLSN